MEDQQHSIDEIFRQSLGDYREAPPAAAWEDVAGRLDSDLPRPRSYFLRWPWISLLLLFVAGGVWLMASKSGKDKKAGTIAEKTVSPRAVATTPLVTVPQDTLTAAAQQSLAASTERAITNSGDHPRRHRHAAVVSNGKTNNRAYAGSAHTTKHSTHTKTAATGNPGIVANSSDAADVADRPLNRQSSRNRRQTAQHKTKAGQQRHTGTKHPQIAVKPATTGNTVPPVAASGSTENPAANKSESPGHTANKPQHTAHKAPHNTAPQNVASANEVKDNATGTTPKPRHHKERIAAHHTQSQSVATTNDGQGRATNAGSKPQNTHNKTKQDHLGQNTGFTAKTGKTHTVGGVASTTTASKKHRPKAIADNSQPPAAAHKATTPARPVSTRDKAKKVIQPAVAKSGPQPKPAVTEPPPPAANDNDQPQAAAPTTSDKDLKAANDAAPDDEDAATDDKGSEAGGGGQTTHPVRSHRHGLNLSFPVSLDALAGYEWAFQQPAPNKGVVALAFSWHLSTKISIGIIPAYRFGNIGSQDYSNGGLFGNVNAVHVDSTSRTDSIQGQLYHFYTYKTRQTYDSILVPKTVAGGKFWEVELPLVFNYQPGNWRFYGGPSINFGGKIDLTTTGAPQSFTKIRTDSLTLTNHQAPSDTFDNYFGVHLSPYSSYTQATSASASSVRIGYTLGIGYQFGGFLVDVSLHQQLTGYSDVAPALQQVYSSPNLRINVGYRIFGPRPEHAKMARERNFLQRL